VAGSHKARHLMALAILGEVGTRLGLTGGARSRRLAIASCGNAALAAAIVARAWGRPLDVYIPEDASAAVVRALRHHGAEVHACQRTPGVAGDPCYLAFRNAVCGGALPFCCQGSDNGLTIEGGETLAWEMIGELGSLAPPQRLDRLLIQVGGGALASACIEAFRDAGQLGRPLPRIHAVQTRGAFPLHRAWERVAARVSAALELGDRLTSAELAEAVRARFHDPRVAAELEHAARNRADFMWPWETTPASVAHGILDDETYDWLSIVRGMLESGGFPVIVSEEQLVAANELAQRHTGIAVDETGSAGLAGLLELSRAHGFAPTERVAIIFSGVRR